MKLLTQPEVLLLETHSKFSLHYLTGHSLEWYFRLIGRSLFYLLALNAAFYMVGSIPVFTAAYDYVFIPILFIIELIVYVWIGGHVARLSSIKTLPLQMKVFTCAASGALVGVVLGIFKALFQLFWFRELWTFYALVNEPVIRGLIGLILAGLVGYLTLLLMRKQNNA